MIKINKKSFKIIIKVIGYFITVLSFLYIFLALKKINFNLFSYEKNIFLFLIIFIFSISYPFLILLLSFLWKTILEFLSNKKLSLLISYKIYSMANIAKYLPGNIMHFISRNLLKDKLNLSHKVVSTATILEIIFDLSTVTIITIFFFIININPFLNFINNYLSFNKLIILFIFFLLIILLSIIFIIYKNNFVIKFYKKFFNKKFVLLILKAIIINFFSFVFLGYLLTFLLDLHLDVDIKTRIYIIGSYTVSWFLGFITPGAPGGLGIRESVLTFLLENNFKLNYLLEAIFIHRLISIIGDIFAYFFGLFIKIKPNIVTGTE